jgi:hypothetical protein
MKTMLAIFLFAGAFSIAIAADTYSSPSFKFSPTSKPVGVNVTSESIEDSTSYSVEMNKRERGVASEPEKINAVPDLEPAPIKAKDTEYWRRPASDAKEMKPQYWRYSPETLP